LRSGQIQVCLVSVRDLVAAVRVSRTARPLPSVRTLGHDQLLVLAEIAPTLAIDLGLVAVLKRAPRRVASATSWGLIGLSSNQLAVSRRSFRAVLELAAATSPDLGIGPIDQLRFPAR
jgi:hypothetical protein